MKLIEALETVRAASRGGGEPLTIALVCGFTPLHLETFLVAHVQRAFPNRRVAVKTGLYGDLSGTARGLKDSEAEFGCVVVEWADLDPRLGIRNPSGWLPGSLVEIAEHAAQQLSSIEISIREAAKKFRTAIVLPTLPLPPVSYTPGAQASEFELRLRCLVDEFAARVAGERGVRVVSPRWLEQISPIEKRWDVKSELSSGFPYSIEQASAVAQAVARVLAPSPAKKGLITDLDDTLWRGLVGEDGEENISWDVAHGSQPHGLYQIVLRSLAETGVLIGVASRNDASAVGKAMLRDDLLLPPRFIYPLEVNWESKAESVTSILKAWNIAPESAVFVDDSQLELAEVSAAHPGIECIAFPANDPNAIIGFLERLRDLFGKDALGAEDALRQESLRSAAKFAEAETRGANVGIDLLRSAGRPSSQFP